MNIKNIQQYRTFYKEEIRQMRDLSTRDEYFIGNFFEDSETKKTKFGWFEIYHGDKGYDGEAEAGIANFLQSFLDMAKDGQAVYEFLQNAVDAESSHFTMIWGKDETDGNHYLLVANNGKMFDLNNIRSILNVGASTKTADSQTIGKFGIGFKLAHRLVGKDNGLQELIYEHSGPILFSWKNYEIENLSKTETIVPCDFKCRKNNKNYELNDDYPWLFKILITCFPCLPENNFVPELPQLTNGKQSSIAPFSHSEYETLSRWVKNNIQILKKETYREGSLFFIRLGSGKETELAETNLNEGVKFALAILEQTADKTDRKKLLETVQINKTPITYPELEYIKFAINKEEEKDTYIYIRFGTEKYDELTTEQQNKFKKEADIEILFGFRKYNQIGNYFEGAPNFYLYFPLSEEVHNFNYVLHSNAFYKASSRTFLHKGNSKEDSINERLLKTIVKKIDIKLEQLSNPMSISSDRELFLDFYAALLTSGKSTNHERFWIEEPYINPICELQKKYIPIRNSLTTNEFTISNTLNQIYIKKTAIDIDTEEWGLANVHWFYWMNEPEITSKAIEKLDIQDFSICDLLSINNTISNSLNSWIGNKSDNAVLILKETGYIEDVSEQFKNNQFKNNLFNIRILEFHNGEWLTINEFQEKEKQGYFIIYNKLNDIRDLFTKLDLKCTVENFDNFQKYFLYFTNESQVRGYTALTRLFSQVVNEEKLKKLSREEKQRIFEAFRTLNDVRIGERIDELKLLTNNLNNVVCFKNLYAQSEAKWLQKFCINAEEENTEYKNYLLNKSEQLYQGIIQPFWEQIVVYIAKNPNQSDEIFENIITAFEKSDWLDKNNHLLHNTIVYQNNVEKSLKIFYSDKLLMLPDISYADIQTSILKYYGIHIPDKCFMLHLSEKPFDYPNIPFNPQLQDIEISFEELNHLLLFSEKCDINFFGYNYIAFKENKYFVHKNLTKKQIFTSESLLINYIVIYYPDQYAFLPEEFTTYSPKVELSGSKLVKHLIDIFRGSDDDDLAQGLNFIEAILINGTVDDKKYLLSKHTYTVLDANWEKERQNKLYLQLLNDVVLQEIKSDELIKIQNKIEIKKGEQTINIGTIDSANDSIEVQRDDRKIILSQSQILDLENSENIKLIHEFNKEAINKEFISKNIADKLFKISKGGISDELIDKFNKALINNNLTIKNSHQLSFLLLSSKFNLDANNNFTIKTQQQRDKVVSIKLYDEQSYCLKGQLFCYSPENCRFIDHGRLLKESFKDLFLLLQNTGYEVFYYNKNNAKDLIAPCFLFIKGCFPNVLKSDESITEKLNYLYRGWENTPQKESKRDEDWEPFLKISPRNFVYHGIQISSEILPEEFITWCNNEKNRELFLQDLGVYVGESPVEKLRRYLVGWTDEAFPEDDFQIINDTLLLNTIKGLATGFMNDNLREPIIYNKTDKKIELIEKIIAHLRKNNIGNVPLIIYHTNDSYSIKCAEDIRHAYWINLELYQKLQLDNSNNLNELYKALNIIKLPDIKEFQSLNNYAELSVHKEYIIDTSSAENNEPFYAEWSQEQKIKLFHTLSIQFIIAVQLKDREGNIKEMNIGTISEGGFYIDNHTEEKYIYYKCSSLDELETQLSEKNSNEANLIKQLIDKRNSLLTSFYSTLNNVGDEATRQLLDLAILDEKLKQERAELMKTIKDDSKYYSYEWFKSYLKLLLTYENKQNTTIQKSISFQEIKKYPINNEISNKYFLLCGANSYIPLNMENFEDFKITLQIENHQDENIKIEGVSKKGQDLLIYSRESIPQSIITLFSKVVKIEINFTPIIDLQDRLYKAFVNRSYIDEWEDIKESLPGLQYIYGPPGTGKTTTLCKLIREEITKDAKTNFLILTPTNKASDVLCKKLVKDKNNEIIIVRLGKPTDPELEEMNAFIYRDSLEKRDLNGINVVASTIHRLPYFEVTEEETNSSFKLFKTHWDYVIFDEASMTNLPSMVFAILATYKAHSNTRFIVAGDPKQIPPIVDINDKELEDLEIQDENIYTMMGIDSFNSDEQILRPSKDKIANLDIQYRSVKHIGQLFSELSYCKLLKHDRAGENSLIKPLPEGFKKIISSHVTFIDIPLNQENSIYKINKLHYSSYQMYSAILVAEMIKYFDSFITNKIEEPWTIGLIAPYKAQAILLNKLITSYGISENIKIYSDTVHGFQGDECDVIFFIPNPNNYRYTGHHNCLLSKKYIYNVAISRARDYLIILHPYEVITNNEFINKIKKSYSSNFGNLIFKKACEIEKVIFQESNHIEKNSYITGHDNVNVFGLTEMKYFIKLNDNAIDIQLRELK
ncbi:RecBCD enzyme subunit RecD [termite gut metagenome]|uniref:RecBCD enzyme subunit RecD n=1 Tax=termite gut metagenome TaxID=433724 RepID=A0A5J4S4T8_9ZZZZ